MASPSVRESARVRACACVGWTAMCVCVCVCVTAGRSWVSESKARNKEILKSYLPKHAHKKVTNQYLVLLLTSR